MLSSNRVAKAAAGAVAGSLLLGGGLLFAMEPDAGSPASAGASRAAGGKVDGGSASAFGLGGEAGVVQGLGLEGPGSLTANAGKQGSAVSSNATGSTSGPGKGQSAFATAGANGVRGVNGTGGAGGRVGTGGGSSNGGAQVTTPGGSNGPTGPKAAPTLAVPQSVSREGSFTVVVPAVAGQAYRLCVSGNVDGESAGKCQPITVTGTQEATLTLTYSGNASAQAPKFTPGTCAGGSKVTVAGLSPGAHVTAAFKSSSTKPTEVSTGVGSKDASVTASLCKV